MHTNFLEYSVAKTVHRMSGRPTWPLVSPCINILFMEWRMANWIYPTPAAICYYKWRRLAP